MTEYINSLSPVILSSQYAPPSRTSQIFLIFYHIEQVRIMKFLTMNVYINAWLDCSNPFISIHNKFDDDLLAHFNAEKINQLIENGDLCIEDLQSTNPEILMETAITLMAVKSSDYITRQVADLSSLLTKREPAPVTILAKTDKKQGLQIADWFLSPTLKAI